MEATLLDMNLRQSAAMDANTEPTFLCDVNVGKLGRWLRILGYDAELMDPRRDEELILRARKEGRVVLTTDSGITARPYIRNCLLIETRDHQLQLKQVCDAFRLRPRPESVFSRCTVCNVPVREVDKTAVESRVPPHAFALHDRFYECPVCGRAYWPGTHLHNTLRALREMGLLDAGAAP